MRAKIDDGENWQLCEQAEADMLVELKLIAQCTGSCGPSTYHLTGDATWRQIMDVGTWRFVGKGWEQIFHTITWAHYDTAVEANRVASDLMNGAARGVTAWVERES
jgi:hypothetical protein